MADQQLASFRVGGCLLGVNVLLVREINRNIAITPVERAPDYVAGLMNLRGQIVTVIDLGIRLGIGARKKNNASRCIILKTIDEIERLRRSGMEVESTSIDLVGLLVDEIGDMVSIPEIAVTQVAARIGELNERFFSGVVKLENDLLLLLRMETLLSQEE